MDTETAYILAHGGRVGPEFSASIATYLYGHPVPDAEGVASPEAEGAAEAGEVVGDGSVAPADPSPAHPPVDEPVSPPPADEPVATPVETPPAAEDVLARG